EQLKGEQVLVALVEARDGNHRLGGRDLAPQLLLQRLLVALWPAIGAAGGSIEEISRALQILEHPQIVVAVLPDVGDEETDRVGLRYHEDEPAKGGGSLAQTARGRYPCLAGDSVRRPPAVRAAPIECVICEPGSAQIAPTRLQHSLRH